MPSAWILLTFDSLRLFKPPGAAPLPPPFSKKTPTPVLHQITLSAHLHRDTYLSPYYRPLSPISSSLSHTVPTHAAASKGKLPVPFLTRPCNRAPRMQAAACFPVCTCGAAAGRRGCQGRGQCSCLGQALVAGGRLGSKLSSQQPQGLPPAAARLRCRKRWSCRCRRKPRGLIHSDQPWTARADIVQMRSQGRSGPGMAAGAQPEGCARAIDGGGPRGMKGGRRKHGRWDRWRELQSHSLASRAPERRQQKQAAMCGTSQRAVTARLLLLLVLASSVLSFSPQGGRRCVAHINSAPKLESRQASRR